MADNRKYYYLKLKESYFDDDAIVLHTFQQHDGIIIKIVFFEFQVIIFSIV